ncbi:MAG: D-glucuronyl C5-epimerase family protein [Acidobacteriota bacterium]
MSSVPSRGGTRTRVAYLARVLRVYAHRSSGPLSFWYERPELNSRAFGGGAEYFMRFAGKTRYQGPFDAAGIPLLDYQGDIGRQYNPIAIAQYGLARFNAWSAAGASADRTAWIAVADWLTREMRPNAHGVRVWMHDFDWPYRQLLRAPWYSGLAQGNGLSLLVRAAKETGDAKYMDAADLAFEPMRRDVADGGVLVTDDQEDVWIEEYLVDRPSHILNGFIWALWGVYDYAQWSARPDASQLWTTCVGTLQRRLSEFDTGWWSLYEARDRGREMLASRYYHALHITQLQVMHRLTGIDTFAECAVRFQTYLDRPSNRVHAFARKAIFKLRHY